MKKRRKIKLRSSVVLNMLDKVSKFFEMALAALILLVVAIKIFDVIFIVLDWDLAILTMEIENILSLIFTLVIGIEFTRMLFRHTPETVLDVLLFVIARQMIILAEGSVNMLLGVIAIAGIFAVKKYLVDAKEYRDAELILDEVDADDDSGDSAS